MTPVKQSAIFNLKAVVRETGLTPDTLRAWERRYGVPQPQRTPGGHRLYSQRDIDLLKWLTARQQEGLSISRAVELWHQLATHGLDPLQVREALPATVPASNAPAALRDDWVGRCLAFDERGAEEVLSQGFALYSPETVCTEVLQKGLQNISERWYRGEATIQQVYFASELGMRRLAGLLAAAPTPTRPGRILLSCPPQERHTFGPLLLTLLLRRQGWDVLYLGANLPTERLDSTLSETRSNLVILAAQQLHTAATLLEVANLAHEAGVTVAYGGGVFNRFPALRSKIPGHFLGESLVEVSPKVEQLMIAPPALPLLEAVQEEYREALAHYRLRQPLIEAHVRQEIAELDGSQAYLAAADSYLTRNIIAALTFGDMSLLDAEIAWLEGLHSHFEVSAGLLYRYLAMYYAAAQAHLGEQGRPIVAWLAHVTGHKA